VLVNFFDSLQMLTTIYICLSASCRPQFENFALECLNVSVQEQMRRCVSCLLRLLLSHMSINSL